MLASCTSDTVAWLLLAARRTGRSRDICHPVSKHKPGTFPAASWTLSSQSAPRGPVVSYPSLVTGRPQARREDTGSVTHEERQYLGCAVQGPGRPGAAVLLAEQKECHSTMASAPDGPYGREQIHLSVAPQEAVVLRNTAEPSKFGLSDHSHTCLLYT